MIKSKVICAVVLLIFAVYTAYLGINWAHGMGQKMADRFAEIDRIAAGK